ncbi:MAG: beta-agarase, partial [Bacteroidota bacterium]
MKLSHLFLGIISVALSLASSCDKEKQVFTNPTTALTLGNLPIPNDLAHPPLVAHWEFMPAYSDEFNYDGKTEDFLKKWRDGYQNAWKGPGLTEWTNKNTDIANGKLIIKASRKPNTEKVHCGVITSKEPVLYPIYTEVSAKVANQVLSSNFWFLSPDSKREIDVVEIYGGDRPDQAELAANPSTNYHVFVRDAKTNRILNNFSDSKHHPLPDGSPYRDGFHRFGVYWKDPFTLDFYYDGKLVRELRRDGIEDPENVGLDRASFMIIDLEDHAWRSKKGIVASDEELADESKNKYFIDYVRTYRPKAVFDGGLVQNGSFDTPSLAHWHWAGDVNINTDFEENNGETYTVKLGTASKIIQEIAVEPNKDYQLTLKVKNRAKKARFGIHELK